MDKMVLSFSLKVLKLSTGFERIRVYNIAIALTRYIELSERKPPLMK